MRIETAILPVHWASYLINDDKSGLDDSDIKAIDAWMSEWNCDAYCVDVADDTAFMRLHDAARWDVLACDCATFTFHVI